ncbi:spondin domain-containing protein [Pelagibaculum spongiae]|uniref:Spondin domain-containing protein n=1 Tax=Pelagibaculum spongiae TaxID=2080658 RepID=A0A2V1H4W6_9GAMM|nr:spondin domain-containing protein [Pelagibaculum spongiae]PVZ71815.1 hypothetical protein DC094_01960 [Pelagibaculum spongiae]
MKNQFYFVAAILCSSLLMGCGGSSSSDNSDAGINNQGAAQANYRLTFSPSWSAVAFPTNFPFGPHFSPIIGATHNQQTVIWRPSDQLSTSGIESMAETGSTSGLRNELQLRQNQATVDQIFSGRLINSPGSTSITLTVSESHPLVSAVSMLAPSPDWFVGIRDVSLRENGQWIDSINLDLALYDAGTDLGERYTSANRDGGDRIITRLTSDSSDTDFANGVHRTSGVFVGTIEIQRVDIP